MPVGLGHPLCQEIGGFCHIEVRIKHILSTHQVNIFAKTLNISFQIRARNIHPGPAMCHLFNGHGTLLTKVSSDVIKPKNRIF